MHDALFNAFRSPYRVTALRSNRYKKVVHYLEGALVILPVLFLPLRSFSVYLGVQVAVLLLFPLFLWVYLRIDETTDVKLDVLKVFVIMVVYFTYLIALSWVMIVMFQPVLKAEYIVVNLAYVFILGLTSILIVAMFFHGRYARHFIHKKRI